ncbi:MAG: hypothetical protein K2W99_04675 [Chthoniobacterales bacterium]|nr:hypothetical protein [Chthoniobacterales bacterium]
MITIFGNLLLFLIILHFLFTAWLSLFQQRLPLEIALVSFLVGLGLFGYLSFWAYYFHRVAGITFSIAAFLLALGALLEAWRYRQWQLLWTSHQLLLPVSTYALFILCLGYFSCHNLDNVGLVAATRWLNLPPDNWIPKYFADQLWHGKISIPMLGDWLSSDRPPLQTGLYLLLHLFRIQGGQDDLFYQVLSSILQALCLLPFFLFVQKENKHLASLALIAIGTTGFMTVHTLFVWPKLLATTYVFIFYLVTMTSFGKNLSREKWIFLSGAAAALAMLAHGAALFALFPIALLYLLRYRFSGMVAALPSALLSLLIFTPWLLYQRFIDPPGDRLIKWHFAGMIPPNHLSPLQAISKAYSAISRDAWIQGRIANLHQIFGGTLDFFTDFFQTCLHPFDIFQSNPHPSIVTRSFFETFYSLGWFSPLLAIAVWLLLGGWRKKISKDLLWLGVTAITSLLIWALVMFIPGSTTIHQGSFFSWIALFICSLTLLWNTARVAFFLALLLNGILFFYCYLLDVVWKQTSGYGVLYLLFSMITFLIFVKSCLALQKIFPSSPNTPRSH